MFYNMHQKLGMGGAVAGLLLVTAIASAQDVKKATGSIKGTISVSGVKDPENVLVYVERVGDKWEPTKHAEVDQSKLTFAPHVLPVVKGTTVTFKNSDPLLHNIFWPKGNGYAARNLGTWGKGGGRKFTFDQLGDVVLLCNIHPEMEGHIVVLQNPFFAMADKDGAYEIKEVPLGKYTVKTWYPKPKKLRSASAEVTVEAGKAATLDFTLGR
jgi:plastocyanin